MALDELDRVYWSENSVVVATGAAMIHNQLSDAPLAVSRTRHRRYIRRHIRLHIAAAVDLNIRWHKP